ncbi:hypothetical protein [Sphingomonas glacialis]|uniref:Muconolactone isomerase domain-containing protein n=1 Tax=Sphingomonas glacialis TaxID=658225 RepID=A0A502FRP5_9SPHN|nr:hypothetical protein [Sphingomonas glacialis]TPG52081.1 hypothetical protein EAH76_15305 [Sphingomonas glacialis]
MSGQSTNRADTFPITRILAIGSVAPDVHADDVQRTMPDEVRDTVALYLDGTIDQWYARHGGGVLFLLNLNDLDAAARVLATLPLAKAGLMKFELTALGPLFPLNGLLRS